MPEDFGAPKGHRTFQPVLVADTCASPATASPSWSPRRCRRRATRRLIEIDYEPLPAGSLEDAAKDGAAKVVGRYARRAMSASG